MISISEKKEFYRQEKMIPSDRILSEELRKTDFFQYKHHNEHFTA